MNNYQVIIRDMNKRRTLRRLIVLVILLSSLALLAWGFWPGIDQTQVLSISPQEMQLPTQASGVVATGMPGNTQMPRIPEARLLILKWPEHLRTGDTDIVRLMVQVDEEGNIIPTASYEEHEIIGEPGLIPDMYDSHNVLAEARLEIAGLQVIPDDLVIQALRPGEDLTFTWSVRSAEVGRLRGTVWLYLRFLPLDGGPDRQIALSAQVIEIEVVNLFGIGGAMARIMGLTGVAASGLLGADDILNSVRWLSKHQRQRR